MRFIDLKKQFFLAEERIRARMDAVLEHGQFILGPEVAELEKQLKDITGAKHCLTCASGSTALDLIMLAWQFGPGDAVFTSPFTFAATAESIARTGATPIFVDIDPASFNIDAAQLAQAVGAVLSGDPTQYPLPAIAQKQKLRPRAVVTVDIFGHPADYDAIFTTAQKFDLLVLEDAAQSLGGTYRGKPLCGCGCDAAAASFFPTKPLGCYGDGGAVFTDSDETAALVDSLRYHGRRDAQHKYDNVRLGMNGRLDTLQAAVLLAKLENFSAELQARQQLADRYSTLLAAIPGITAPSNPSQGESVWAQYTVMLPENTDRKALMAAMKEDNIPTMIHYPKSLHMQEAFSFLGYTSEDFPAVRNATARVLSLPMHPYLDATEQDKVVECLKRFLHA